MITKTHIIKEFLSLLQQLFSLQTRKTLLTYCSSSDQAVPTTVPERRDPHGVAQASVFSSQPRTDDRQCKDCSKQPSLSRGELELPLPCRSSGLPLAWPISMDLPPSSVDADQLRNWSFSLRQFKLCFSWNAAIEPWLGCLPPWLSSWSSEQADLSLKEGRTTSHCSTHLQP